MYGTHGNGYSMMHAGGWMVGFGVLTLVLLGLALMGVVANLYLHMSRGPQPAAHVAAPPPAEARLVLDGRLARGEVTLEEYKTVRALIDT